MNSQFKKATNKKLNILAYYQIAGGTLGLAMICWNLVQTDIKMGFLFFVLILIGGLYSFSIFCGWKILKEKVDAGLKISIFLQAIQIFGFTLSGYAFKFVAGVSVIIHIPISSGSDFELAASFSDFILNIQTDNNLIKLSVNIVAVYLIQYINDLQQDIQEYRLLHQIDQDNNTLKS